MNYYLLTVRVIGWSICLAAAVAMVLAWGRL